MSVPRGPCTLPVLRQAWSNGLIDETTLVWGQGLIEWVPARNVAMLLDNVVNREVKIATWLKRKFVLEPEMRAKQKRDAARMALPPEERKQRTAKAAGIPYKWMFARNAREAAKIEKDLAILAALEDGDSKIDATWQRP